jgi:Ni/Fe-hydrogenase subunit HybB-like protein
MSSDSKTVQRLEGPKEEVDQVLFTPLEGTTRQFWVAVVVLVFIVLLGVSAYYVQFTLGLGVTGLNYTIYWGMYIINTIFFIAISYGGTLTSAALRVLRVKWRTPITRAAEVMTVAALSIGGVNIILDMGRPDRVLNIILHGRFQSPIVWDFYAVSIYLIFSFVYLYLPLIPDFAELQHKYPRRRWLYRPLSLGWKDSPRQKKLLNLGMDIMAYAMIPVAILVHTVLSYMFALTTQPMWHSTLLGPYFVMGAVYSGLAGLIVAMALLRRFMHLEDYLKPKHFNYLALFLLAMTSVWAYFTFSEYITTYYGQEPSHTAVFNSKFYGEFAPFFYAQIVLCLVIPLILIFPRFRKIPGTVVVSVSVLIGMWLERYLIIVPTLARPRLPSDLPHTIGIYIATSTEWIIMAASAAAIVLIYLFMVKLFPIISVWEIREEREEEKEKLEREPEQPPERRRVFRSPLSRRSS